MARHTLLFQTMTIRSWNGPNDFALFGHWREENQRGFDMKKLVLTTAALLAGTALAAAQGMNPPAGNKSEGAAPAPTAQQKAPAEKTAPAQTTGQAPKAGADAKAGANSEAPKANADVKAGAKGDMKANDAKADSKADTKAAADKAGDKADTKSAADAKSKSSTDTKAAADKNGKDGKDGKSSAQTESKDGKASAQTDSKNKESTGQGAAGSRAAANISTEQRTKIRTVITEKVKVKPETNVNFSISVGTRVPRTVHYHPLPAEVISIYPEWRGYYFILVGSQIVIIEPSTYEIVYVIA